MIGLQCLTCTRRHEIGAASGRTTCDAYPAGVPWGILEGRIDHRQPYAGDHGLRYNPQPGIDTSEMDQGVLEEIVPGPADHPLIQNGA